MNLRIPARNWLNKANLLFLFLFVLSLGQCQTWYRLQYPVKIGDSDPEFLEYKETFKVYYDPAIPRSRVLGSLELGYKEWERLRSNFFPGKKKKIYIVMFADREGYNRQAGSLPKSLARFDRKTNRIYLTQQTGRTAWRHELVHALLDGIRLSDYRIQEGLAWFLQSQDFPDKLSCASGAVARPVPFSRQLGQLRKTSVPLDDFFSSRRHKLDDVLFLARSAYYIQFVWSKKALQKSLRYYLKYPHSWFEYELTRAERGRLKKLYQEFEDWLRSPAPLKGVRGC